MDEPVRIDQLKNRRWTVGISNETIGLDLSSVREVNEVHTRNRPYTGAQIWNVMLGANSTSISFDLSALNVSFVDNKIRALQNWNSSSAPIEEHDYPHNDLLPKDLLGKSQVGLYVTLVVFVIHVHAQGFAVRLEVFNGFCSRQ